MNETYFLNRQVILMPYDSHWPKWFIDEKNKISSTLTELAIDIEHIGSTAIEGLAAKPILDIMIGAKNIEIVEKCIAPLEHLAYDYVPALEENFPDRRFLHKGPNLANQHIHLHMVVKHSDFWKRQLFFRDYLRQNKNAALAYQTLKYDLAKQYKMDVAGYTDAKSDFIQNILDKMKE